MELRKRVQNILDWCNKRLNMADNGLDGKQIEVIEFCMLNSLQGMVNVPKEILELLDNITYWDTCPTEDKEVIRKFLKNINN